MTHMTDMVVSKLYAQQQSILNASKSIVLLESIVLLIVTSKLWMS